MEPIDIMDWSRDSPQWSEILEVVSGSGTKAEPTSNPLWPLYGPLIGNDTAGGSLVLGQIGQSLDGRIATESGHSHYINGKAAIIHLHRLRALVDAVIIGVGTAIADDAQLTVRHVIGAQPARVIIDPRGRLSPSARCLKPDGARRVVVQADDYSRPEGVECLRLAARKGCLDPNEILAALHDVGLRRVLIEGGAMTVSRFLDAKSIDRLHVMVAPLIIGSGKASVQLPVIDSLDAAARPAATIFGLPDGDVLFDCDFRQLQSGNTL